MEEPDAQLDAIARQIVDVAFRLHRDVGPGLLESAYETLLSAKLTAIGLSVERQVAMDVVVDDIQLASAFRLDLLVNRSIIIEVNSIERTLPIHSKQLLTYLRLGGFPLGFVINFGTAMFKDGIRRLINSDTLLASSRLGANQKD
ncbi:GxxExxY protein [Erythrobacter sanguineus]|uniref:GxxExxY protein n=1 Tax=Erythrobacter sanguineus TaxID=198312 RepID=A0A1M7S607_9SPHN|nr:GxxExxY protein [Erythrobacter sanguineus]SHN54099.1 GxxExxY protein [Erythrobacter sanguineus]